MVCRAPKLLAIAEPEADDRLDAIAHDSQWPACSHSGAWPLSRRLMRVDAEVLIVLRQLIKLLEGDQSARGVDARIAREAGVGRVDPPVVGAGVPLVDRG